MSNEVHNYAYTCMKNIIEKKYYEDKAIVIKKLNAFYSFDQITDDEYSELMQLAEEKFKETTPETTE